MFNRLNPLVVIALFTSCAMLAFAFYQRYEPSRAPSALVFYLAAAIICVLPPLHALFRHKTCRTKTLS